MIFNQDKKIEYIEEVSIIISARNEEKNIPYLLDCLMNQNYPLNKYEVIIVNDRSSDNSKEMLKTYQSKYDNLKIVNI